MVPIFIISLPEASARKERITALMNSLDLKFEFVDAIDGRQFDVIHHPNYAPLKRLLCFGKHLTGGDIGCTLSHKKIYQRMVDENIGRALIFEDDIIIRDGFKVTLNEILSFSVPYDMIRFLGSDKLERLKLRSIYKFKSGFMLTRHTGMPGGSHATLMALTGAQKMLKHMDHMAYPIDALMGRSWITGVDWYTVRPGLVPQDRTIESTIGDDARFDEKQDISGKFKYIFPISRGFFKMSESIGKKYWYLKTYFKDKKYGNL